MGDRVFTGWINTAGSVETSNTCLPFQHELDEVMFINVNSVSSPTPTSRVPNAAFWVTLRRDKVHGEEAAHITPPHKSFCNIPIFCKIYAGMFIIQCVLCRTETI